MSCDTSIATFRRVITGMIGDNRDGTTLKIEDLSSQFWAIRDVNSQFSSIRDSYITAAELIKRNLNDETCIVHNFNEILVVRSES
jgi:hypothetical protein